MKEIKRLKKITLDPYKEKQFFLKFNILSYQSKPKLYELKQVKNKMIRMFVFSHIKDLFKENTIF